MKNIDVSRKSDSNIGISKSMLEIPLSGDQTPAVFELVEYKIGHYLLKNSYDYTTLRDIIVKFLRDNIGMDAEKYKSYINEKKFNFYEGFSDTLSDQKIKDNERESVQNDTEFLDGISYMDQFDIMSSYLVENKTKKGLVKSESVSGLLQKSSMDDINIKKEGFDFALDNFEIKDDFFEDCNNTNSIVSLNLIQKNTEYQENSLKKNNGGNFMKNQCLEKVAIDTNFTDKNLTEKIPENDPGFNLNKNKQENSENGKETSGKNEIPEKRQIKKKKRNKNKKDKVITQESNQETQPKLENDKKTNLIKKNIKDVQIGLDQNEEYDFYEIHNLNKSDLLEKKIYLEDGYWDGLCLGEEPCGFGAYVFDNGAVYEGYNFKGNMRNGKFCKGNIVYEGCLDYRTFSGKGSFKDLNEQIEYDGSFKNMRFNGFGVYTSPEYRHEGFFKNGVKEGKGHLENFISFEIYNGMWKNNKRAGFGEVTLKNNPDFLYKGSFKDDQPNGYGESRLPENLRDKTFGPGIINYKGNFRLGSMDGKGTIVSASNDVWDVTYKNGVIKSYKKK